MKFLLLVEVVLVEFMTLDGQGVVDSSQLLAVLFVLLMSVNNPASVQLA